ncbi:MAG: hypothetical protein CVT98_06320 [Bacteroidetes bacterium HGW-Bacteroidetes-15]|nr:MAG: hypothetical protein CVT98_06320 [Bacteroidetes bacterium HGW-Bacteroidetes-15]
MKVTSKYIILFILTLFVCLSSIAQVNSKHVKVKGYTKSDGTYVAPYYRTAPNSTNRDNFSTKGNTNPYTETAGWIEPDNKINTLYSTNYTPKTTASKSENNYETTYTDRIYVEDEFGQKSLYLKEVDKRTFGIYDLKNELILFLVINHRGDWRIFNTEGIYIKTIFLSDEN